jgi:excisionase family DNA binding protein
MPDPHSPRWLSPTQAADRLGVDRRTIRRYIAGGQLRGYRVRGSRLIRIDRHELDALLQPIRTGERHAG